MPTLDQEHKHLSNPTLVTRYHRILKASQRSWEDWLDIGYNVAARRSEASLAAHGTKRGPIYAAKLEQKFGAFYDIFKKLSQNGTLVALDQCIGQLAMINAYRRSLPEDQRPSNPVTVWNGYKRSTFSPPDYDEDGEEPKEAKPPSNRIVDRNRERNQLLARIAELTEQLSDQAQTTNDPSTNALRGWRTMVADRGHNLASARLFRDTCQHGLAMAERLIEDLSDDL